MKLISILLLTLSITIAAQSQQEIKIETIKDHIGDSVKVCTKIYGGIYLDRSKGTPTLLNAGGTYPGSPLTLVIWPDVRKEFKNKPEDFYKDKEVCITGRIELFKDKPQIVIHSENQIAVQ